MNDDRLDCLAECEAFLDKFQKQDRQVVREGRVEFVTRYETLVHARNVNSDYGTPVVVYADSKQDAVNKAAAVGWGGYTQDARVTVVRVTQEPVVIPPACHIPPGETDN